MNLKAAIQNSLKALDPYRPLITLEVSAQALVENLKTFQSYCKPAKIAPVLKGNAYGHGLVETASVLKNEDCPFFALDSLFEARQISGLAPKVPKLVMGYTPPQNIFSNKKNNVTFAITDLEQLKQISAGLRRKTLFHLKIDTGMNRQGLKTDQWLESITIIEKNKNITIEGLMSHLSDADGANDSFTQNQIRQWSSALKIFKQHLPQLRHSHLANTAGANFSSGIDATAIRLGAGLYGVPQGLYRGPELKPALQLKTIICGLKTIQANEAVGYGQTFKASRESKIALVPVGYYEGVDRRLSNSGFFKINKAFCKILGRVNMNMTVVDITEAGNVKVGDEVIVISNKREDHNSVENIARLCQTVPHEILCTIPPLLKRLVV